MKEERVRQEIRKAKRLVWFRPVFFAALFLSLGILFAYCNRFYGISVRLVLGVGILTGAILIWNKEGRRKRILAFLLCVLSFFCGAFSFENTVRAFKRTESIAAESIVQGTLTARKDYDDFSIAYFSDVKVDGKAVDGELIAYLYSPFSENYRLGDCVLLQGTVQTDTELFGTYGFKAEEIKRNAKYYMNVSSSQKIGKSSNLFFAVRNRMQDVLQNCTDEEVAAVMTGILLGDTDGISDSLYESVRYGGIAHIFAVSGLHVGALFGFCMLILNRKKGRLPKPIRWTITAFVLIFYAGVCGFSSSVVRATVICLTLYGLSLFRFHSDFLERIGLSALLILAVYPTALFEVGFQLSFAACLGIAFLALPLKNALRKCLILQSNEEKEKIVFVTVKEKFVSLLSVSVATQAFTAPIMLWHFSYLSLWGLLLNLLFVPLISAVFSVLLFLVIVAMVCPFFIGRVLLYLPDVLFSGTLLLFEIVDFSSFSLSFRLNTGGIVVYYMALLFASDKMNLSPRKKAVVFVGSVSLCIAATLFCNL